MPNPNVGLHAANAATCDPGYYLENGACVDCGSGYYCPGGEQGRISCHSLLPMNSPEPSGGIYTLYNGQWNSDDAHASQKRDCLCRWYFSDKTREKYMVQNECQFGHDNGEIYVSYEWCRNGYYATVPLNYNSWYRGECAPCDNGPAHAHYTSYSTPSVMYAVESNCPWACDAGYGRVGDTCQPLCTTGVTALRAGATTAPLFTAPPSSPALAVRTGGGVCYGNLTAGRATGINVTVAGTTYHLE